MAAHYRIGEFAELSGISAKTLRFYDEIGLLRPAGVDQRTRYRHYLPHQLHELASILALKNLGVSLADIRHLVNKGESNKDRRALLTELKESLQCSIETATRSLSWIEAAIDELDGSCRPIPVVVKRRPAIPIASVRAKVENYTDMLEFERELLTVLPAPARGDLRGVLWHSCADSGSLEGEAFVMLKQRVPPKSFYDLKRLAPATVACAYSGLEDESAEHAYDVLKTWMNRRGYRLAGPKREIYLDQMLEIQFPLKS